MITPGKSERDFAKYAQAISELAQGGSNALGASVVILTPGATETSVDDSRCSAGSLIAPVPTSASAAVAVVWLKETRRGGFTWGHDASAATDRTFRYEVRRP